MVGVALCVHVTEDKIRLSTVGAAGGILEGTHVCVVPIGQSVVSLEVGGESDHSIILQSRVMP